MSTGPSTLNKAAEFGFRGPQSRSHCVTLSKSTDTIVPFNSAPSASLHVIGGYSIYDKKP